MSMVLMRLLGNQPRLVVAEQGRGRLGPRSDPTRFATAIVAEELPGRFWWGKRMKMRFDPEDTWFYMVLNGLYGLMRIQDTCYTWFFQLVEKDNMRFEHTLS